MVALRAVVDDNHKLIIELPADFPPGEVEVRIEPISVQPPTIENQGSTEAAAYTPPVNPTREAALEKMRAAGALATGFEIPDGTVLLSPEELLKVGTPAPGAGSSLDILNEDRDAW